MQQQPIPGKPGTTRPLSRARTLASPLLERTWAILEGKLKGLLEAMSIAMAKTNPSPDEITIHKNQKYQWSGMEA